MPGDAIGERHFGCPQLGQFNLQFRIDQRGEQGIVEIFTGGGCAAASAALRSSTVAESFQSEFNTRPIAAPTTSSAKAMAGCNVPCRLDLLGLMIWHDGFTEILSILLPLLSAE
ncbi:MAG: hypothetical protein R3C12_13405 [Planctomycetaceae bacterium]